MALRRYAEDENYDSEYRRCVVVGTVRTETTIGIVLSEDNFTYYIEGSIVAQDAIGMSTTTTVTPTVESLGVSDIVYFQMCKTSNMETARGCAVQREGGLFPSDLFLDTNDYIDVSLVALFDFNFTTEIIENGCPANYCPAQTDSGTCEAQNPIDDTFPCVWNGGECGSDGFEQCYDHGVIGFYGECYARSGTGLFENFYDAYNIVNLTSEEECNEIITADAPGEGACHSP